MSKTRIAAFDAIKLFAIILVLYGHCILHLQNYKFNEGENVIFRFIYSFHMPLFMMVSGFFGAKYSSESFISQAKKKFKQLLLPSITFGITLSFLTCYLSDGGVFTSVFIRSYWFLKSAFICNLLFLVAINFRNKNNGIILTVILSQLISVFNVCIMYPCFVAGNLLDKYKNVFISKIWITFWFSIIIYCLCFYFYNSDILTCHPIRIIAMMSMSSNEIVSSIGVHFFKMTMGIAGSIATISLFVGIGKFIPNSKLGLALCRCGSYTLGIYLLQAIILEQLMMHYLDYSNLGWYEFNLVIAPIMSIIVLLLCLLSIFMIKKIKLLRIYFLGDKN